MKLAVPRLRLGQRASDVSAIRAVPRGFILRGSGRDRVPAHEADDQSRDTDRVFQRHEVAATGQLDDLCARHHCGKQRHRLRRHGR
jgi:hypothetical protein